MAGLVRKHGVRLMMIRVMIQRLTSHQTVTLICTKELAYIIRIMLLEGEQLVEFGAFALLIQLGHLMPQMVHVRCFTHKTLAS